MITDYEPFLRVAEDGYIWWLLKDAVRLGAGFLPVHDDHLTLVPELRAPNNRAQANERTLLGAFGDNRSTIEGPITFERDGFRYVEATGFLNWLAQYIAQTQLKITFPNELGRKLSIAKAKAAASRPAVTIHEFQSLTLALEGWFDKNLDDLPINLRKRVESEFFPVHWDGLSVHQRQSVAIQRDYQCDPATEKERKYWWTFFAQLHDLEKQRDQWLSAATSTAIDIALKESRLEELQQKIDRMELQQRQAGGDYFPGRDGLVSNKDAIVATDYIAYPKAMKILREKWQATPEELAVWIILGPETGGIAAYKNAQTLIPPPRFYINGPVLEDILLPLMSSWFRRDDVERFKPADRYITGMELIERWAKHPSIRPEAFILAKIAESRLMDFHPNFGSQHGTLVGWIIHPLEAGLFALKQIERIEAEDLDTGPVLPKALVAPDQNALYAKGGRPKSPLAEAVEKAYLHFRDKGDVAILRPGNLRSFLKSFKSLLNDDALSPSFGNGNIRTYIAERIKEVKYSTVAECFVVTHDRPDGRKIKPGDKYSQKAIAKLLTNLRKKYPLPS